VKIPWTSPIAGTWYQNSRMMLEYDIECLCRDITVVRRRNVCAAVVPHATYRFSGRVAAGVFLRIDPGRYARVVILAPSHYEELRNQISAPLATHILTPLGEVAVDCDWMKRFRALPFATNLPAAHSREHSDQIQLPLIQTCLSSSLPVCCLVCGQFDADKLLEIADSLRPLLDEETLVVVSSDFTHFGATFGDIPKPGDSAVKAEATMNAFELFASGDLQGFLRHIKTVSGRDLCVRDPLPLLMALLPETAKVTRTTSETPDPKSPGSGYTGALVEGRWTAPTAWQRTSARSREPLSPEEGRKLVQLAENAIKRAFKTGATRPIWGLEPVGLTARLQTARGGFVTLTRGGELQGRMGEVVPHRAIWQVVVEHALNAAFHDSRVRPVEAKDWPAYRVEVAVLTEPRPVESWRDIHPERHGIVLRKGSASAVELPTPGKPLEKILGELAVRAGLPSDGWRDGASFLVFEAQVFTKE
jgi:AmmeMemoRadiSam system protein B/AmmeMemoRadiSam system protein A